MIVIYFIKIPWKHICLLETAGNSCFPITSKRFPRLSPAEASVASPPVLLSRAQQRGRPCGLYVHRHPTPPRWAHWGTEVAWPVGALPQLPPGGRVPGSYSAPGGGPQGIHPQSPLPSRAGLFTCSNSQGYLGRLCIYLWTPSRRESTGKLVNEERPRLHQQDDRAGQAPLPAYQGHGVQPRPFRAPGS